MCPLLRALPPPTDDAPPVCISLTVGGSVCTHVGPRVCGYRGPLLFPRASRLRRLKDGDRLTCPVDGKRQRGSGTRTTGGVRHSAAPTTSGRRAGEAVCRPIRQ